MSRSTYALSPERLGNGRYFTIAVDGRGGSGKSVFADCLGELLPGFVVIHGDEYFEPHQHPITWGDFNEPRFRMEVLNPINAGHRIFSIRPFDFANDHLGPPRAISVDEGIIVERCYSHSLRVDWDMKIWIETSREICLLRGLQRDGAAHLGERARSAWTQIWQPREDSYISREDPARHADFIVDGTVPFTEQRSSLGW